jgi:hypothetical protein
LALQEMVAEDSFLGKKGKWTGASLGKKIYLLKGTSHKSFDKVFNSND